MRGCSRCGGLWKSAAECGCEAFPFYVEGDEAPDVDPKDCSTVWHRVPTDEWDWESIAEKAAEKADTDSAEYDIVRNESGEVWLWINDEWVKFSVRAYGMVTL